MNARERFRAICRFERPGDVFIWGVSSWNEALERWVREGLPVGNVDERGRPRNMREVNALLIGQQDQKESIRPNTGIRGMGQNGNPPWVAGVDPMFEPEVIRVVGDTVIARDYDGALVERTVDGEETIPRYLEYPVTDRASWERYKVRLDPHSAGRWPDGWERMDGNYFAFPIKPEHVGRPWSERDFPLGMNLMTLIGAPRNYLGLEGLSYAIFDDLKLVDEMIEHQAYLAYEGAKRVFDAGVTLDWVWIWEDIAYNRGPLVSPDFMKKHVMPRYRKVVDLLRSNGVSALICDCDGNIDELLPLYLDAGINATYPLECAAGMDGRDVRRRFGNEPILIGNIDKRALARGRREIDAELEKAKDLLGLGGYFPSVDHHIPPDVPYENLVYYLNGLRRLAADPASRRVI